MNSDAGKSSYYCFVGMKPVLSKSKLEWTLWWQNVDKSVTVIEDTIGQTGNGNTWRVTTTFTGIVLDGYWPQMYTTSVWPPILDSICYETLGLAKRGHFHTVDKVIKQGNKVDKMWEKYPAYGGPIASQNKTE